MGEKSCNFSQPFNSNGNQVVREAMKCQQTATDCNSFVGVKINYHLLTSIYVTSILSYTVLEDDANDEK